jgi:phytoene synthase
MPIAVKSMTLSTNRAMRASPAPNSRGGVMKSNASTPARPSTRWRRPSLKVYCHRVAGVVGLMSARIFGYSDEHTLDYAAELGLAFQLTNIIRDVGEDARRNRVYLPLDELAAAGIDASQIVHASAATQASEAFRQLMMRQVERAQAAYDSAFAKLPAADRKPQLPGIIMAAIYRTLLDEIRDDGCRVLTHRTSLPPARKLWIAFKTWIRG